MRAEGVGGSVVGKAGCSPVGWYQRHSRGWSFWRPWFGGMGQGGRRQVRGGGGILVLIPLLIAPIFLAIVVFVFVKKEVDHGRSVRAWGVIIGVTPAAPPLKSRCYLLKSGSTCRWPVRTLARGRIVTNWWPVGMMIEVISVPMIKFIARTAFDPFIPHRSCDPRHSIAPSCALRHSPSKSPFRIFCFVAKTLAGRRGTTPQKRSPRGATGNDGISDDVRRGEK